MEGLCFQSCLSVILFTKSGGYQVTRFEQVHVCVGGGAPDVVGGKWPIRLLACGRLDFN